MKFAEALMSLCAPMMRVDALGQGACPGTRQPAPSAPDKRGDEGVAPARDVDDVTALVLPVGQHLAKSGDMDTKAALFDNHIRPDPRK